MDIARLTENQAHMDMEIYNGFKLYRHIWAASIRAPPLDKDVLFGDPFPTEESSVTLFEIPTQQRGSIPRKLSYGQVLSRRICEELCSIQMKANLQVLIDAVSYNVHRRPA